LSYKNLRAAVTDLEKTNQLVRIPFEVDPNLEMAEIHRRIFDAKGPAILFEKVKGSPFEALSNLYGTFDRTEFLFRHTIAKVQKIIELKIDPTRALKSPFKYLDSSLFAINGLPKKTRSIRGFKKTTLSNLPQIVSWPDDGGAFITLPQVCSLPTGPFKIMQSNVGMYRIQLNGNVYEKDEIGLHYQLHRGIGVHHKMHMDTKEPFKVSIFVGGPPSNALSAIMPLPEGLSELSFAGLLNGSRFKYCLQDGYVMSRQADFCITGIIEPNRLLPEGPFGDHLGYYSLEHDFPVLKVTGVYHRPNPIWHFTVVGRPPQEDSSFGHIIHLLVKDLAKTEFPGLMEINAVDAAGVHPLLLAVGKERYMPFRNEGPEELLTISNHLLGKGQTSLAKYLFISNYDDAPALSAQNIPAFFKHMLERINLQRDLHFQTCTTIDTLDYSGTGWNAGSKLVVAARGAKIRDLQSDIPAQFALPEGFGTPVFWQPGVLCISGPPASEKILFGSHSLDPILLMTFMV